MKSLTCQFFFITLKGIIILCPNVSLKGDVISCRNVQMYLLFISKTPGPALIIHELKRSLTFPLKSELQNWGASCKSYLYSTRLLPRSVTPSATKKGKVTDTLAKVNSRILRGGRPSAFLTTDTLLHFSKGLLQVAVTGNIFTEKAFPGKCPRVWWRQGLRGSILFALHQLIVLHTCNARSVEGEWESQLRLPWWKRRKLALALGWAEKAWGGVKRVKMAAITMWWKPRPFPKSILDVA